MPLRPRPPRRPEFPSALYEPDCAPLQVQPEETTHSMEELRVGGRPLLFGLRRRSLRSRLNPLRAGQEPGPVARAGPSSQTQTYDRDGPKVVLNLGSYGIGVDPLGSKPIWAANWFRLTHKAERPVEAM